MQRLVVLAATSLPSCAAFASPGATFFAFGLTNLALEAGLRRVRPSLCWWSWLCARAAHAWGRVVGLWFSQAVTRGGSLTHASPAPAPALCPCSPPQLRLHLQLLSSLAVYVATLTLMQQHPEGSPGRAIITRECPAAPPPARCMSWPGIGAPPTLLSAARRS